VWRFNLADLSDNDIRRLRLLIKMGKAEAHLVTKSEHPWPIKVQTHPRQWQEPVDGTAIN
jgi:hypothetical protein